MSDMPSPRQRGKSSRSGSETRQRSVINKFRSTDAERAEMQANAAAAGLSLGSYIRALGLTKPRTRYIRRPLADVHEVARLLGQVGRIGGNLAQLLKLANRGQIVLPDELEPAVSEARAFVAKAAKALKG
jgi:hypothetical protein